jgi:hypothetical protein
MRTLTTTLASAASAFAMMTAAAPSNAQGIALPFFNTTPQVTNCAPIPVDNATYVVTNPTADDVSKGNDFYNGWRAVPGSEAAVRSINGRCPLTAAFPHVAMVLDIDSNNGPSAEVLRRCYNLADRTRFPECNVSSTPTTLFFRHGRAGLLETAYKCSVNPMPIVQERPATGQKLTTMHAVCYPQDATRYSVTTQRGTFHFPNNGYRMQ